ncbi:MAG: DUF389 domain-containing protein [Acidimicrobiia bacterium]
MGELREAFDRWISPATIRGMALIAAGAFALAFPKLSTFTVGLLIAIVLVITGITDIWQSLPIRQTSWHKLLLGIVWVAAGIGLAFYRHEALTVFALILGILALVRGTVIFVVALRNRANQDTWLYDLVRGLVYVATGAFLLLIPDALVSATVVAIALSAVVAGFISISFGVAYPERAAASELDIGGYAKEWLLARDLGESMRSDVVNTLYFEKPDSVQKQVAFWVLLVLSVVIATLGVLADSTAVVIGAMLVAPLMTPIMGVAAGIVNGWMRRVVAAFATVVGGVVVGVGVAWIVAAWMPQLVPLASNAQVTSRTSPTLIDLMIAIAAGAAGAYATADRRVSSSITGVAIAVALVPPLAVVGVMLQATQFNDALGAFLLFLTNLVMIILIASVVFLVMGLAPVKNIRENRDKMKTVVLTVVLAAVIIIVPLAFTSEGIIVSASRQATVQTDAEAWLAPEQGLTLIRAEIDGNDVTIMVSGDGTLPPIDNLVSSLETDLNTTVTVSVEYFPSETVTSDTQ